MDKIHSLLFDYILIEPIEEKTKIGDLEIPQTSKEKPQKGIVIKVGPGAYQDGTSIPMFIKTGDRVLYKKWGMQEVKLENDSKEYLLVKQEDIMAVLKREE